MRQYETMVIIDAMISDEAIDAEVQSIASIISAGGEIIRRDDWGKRKMAYSINKKTHGYYVIFYFKAEVSVVAALEVAFKHNENLLRWTTLVDYPMTDIIYDKNLVQSSEEITPIDADDGEAE
ncbi:MAG TPA: 30S ribosomal protein S6 [Fibrobacter sp.]|nr:30S ribosomal protein S6 [Fibrobacter sp.]